MTISMKLSSVVLSGALAGLLGLSAPVSAEVKLPNPVITTGTPSDPIVYPTCPLTFTLTQKGAHVYACKIIANEGNVNAHMAVAHTLNCGISDHWQEEPVVTMQGSGNQITIRTKCFAD